jgi:CxxC motif-containing protein
MPEQKAANRWEMEVMCLSCASQCKVLVYRTDSGLLDTKGGCPRGEKYAIGKAKRELEE